MFYNVQCFIYCTGRRFDESVENQLMTWEIMNTDDFIRKNASTEQMKMENQVLETTEK